MPRQARSPRGFGKCPVTGEIEAVLRKIEHWHQDSIAKFKIIYRDGKGFWHGVRWDGKAASCFALSETDERRARKKMRESEGTRTVPEVPLGIITPAVLLISKMTNSP